MPTDPALEQSTAPIEPAGVLLLVDDNDEIADLVAAYLRLQLWQVVHTRSVPEAVALVQTTTFTAILLDYVIPGERGCSGVVKLRKAAPSTPIILHTGHASSEVTIAAGQAGVTATFSKSSWLEGHKEGQPPAVHRLVACIEGAVARGVTPSSTTTTLLLDQIVQLQRQILAAQAETKIAVARVTAPVAPPPSLTARIAAMIPALPEKVSIRLVEVLYLSGVAGAGWLAHEVLP